MDLSFLRSARKFPLSTVQRLERRGGKQYFVAMGFPFMYFVRTTS